MGVLPMSCLSRFTNMIRKLCRHIWLQCKMLFRSEKISKKLTVKKAFSQCFLDIFLMIFAKLQSFS
jgi:hypothetical protein